MIDTLVENFCQYEIAMENTQMLKSLTCTLGKI